jgi:hypothetical protein
MFGKFNWQQGDAPEEANWEGWTPPWMSREGQGPRGWQGPRGPFGHRFGGPGGQFGPWHGWGHRGWQGPHGPFGPGFGPGRHWGIPNELLALRAEAIEVARLFAIASRGAVENKERLSQLRAILDRSHKELTEMIYGSAQGRATGEGESASSATDVGQA